METKKQYNELDPRDKELWKIAKKRVGFKRHLATYVIINTMFWFLWYFSEGKNADRSDFPWPVWPMLGWGIGLAFNFLEAYAFNKSNAIEKEFERLKGKNGN